ncbi:TPA: hypothetical protein HA241_06085 [Candidatus Woesearchaeota archaeon]|nr:hypothetical protein [Candidatus Woesearchaeota archaeon]
MNVLLKAVVARTIALAVNGETMIRKLLQKIKEKISSRQEHTNRFLKFYYAHHRRLLKERRSTYYTKREKGICVRCSRKSLAGIIFCSYHQKMQKGYNQKARAK